MEDKKLNIKLNNGIKDIREIKMNTDEKKRILENILNSDLVFRGEPIKSPFWSYLFVSKFGKNSFTFYGSAFCLLIFLSGGLVFASSTSLPGDILYPLRVSVIEPFGGVLTFSTLAKIKYESNLATERLVDAEILSDRDNLTSVKEKELNNLLENHTKSFNKAINKFQEKKSTKKETDKNEDKDKTIINFQARMDARARVFNSISENKKVEAISAKVPKAEQEERKPEKHKKRKEVTESIEKLLDSETSSRK